MQTVGVSWNSVAAPLPPPFLCCTAYLSSLRSCCGLMQSGREKDIAKEVELTNFSHGKNGLSLCWQYFSFPPGILRTLAWYWPSPFFLLVPTLGEHSTYVALMYAVSVQIRACTWIAAGLEYRRVVHRVVAKKNAGHFFHSLTQLTYELQDTAAMDARHPLCFKLCHSSALPFLHYSRISLSCVQYVFVTAGTIFNLGSDSNAVGIFSSCQRPGSFFPGLVYTCGWIGQKSFVNVSREIFVRSNFSLDYLRI